MEKQGQVKNVVNFKNGAWPSEKQGGRVKKCGQSDSEQGSEKCSGYSAVPQYLLAATANSKQICFAILCNGQGDHESNLGNILPKIFWGLRKVKFLKKWGV